MMLKIGRVAVGAALLAAACAGDDDDTADSSQGTAAGSTGADEGATDADPTPGSTSGPAATTGGDNPADDSEGDTPTTGPSESTGPGADDTDTTGDDDDSETGAPVGCYDYDAFTPSTVSYRDDVMPIFAARCSGCHGDPEASVYYGMGGTTEAEAVAIYDNQINGVPKQAPDLSFVVPGDPLRSYMMAKMEYDDPGGTCSEIQCSEPGCDLQAPPAAQLPENELAIMRSWILGGALND